MVEAVPEHLDLKREIFAALDTVVKPDAVLATNTSSLSVTEISVATHNPRRVVGMHFFNPAPVLKFVEVIRTVVTEDDVVDDVVALATRIGKMPVVVGDKAGFIANALLFGYLNHAVVDVRVAVRDPRGHRRRDDARLRPADGAAGPDGPDRARHRLRDPRHDVQAGARPAARAEPGAQADGHRGPEGPQERARLLHLRRARLVAASCRDAAPPPVPAARRRAAAACSSVGVVGSGTMATGIVEVFAKAGLDVLAVARSEEKGAAVLAAVGRSLEKAVGRGKLEQADADAALARGAHHHLAAGPRTGRPRRRGGGRGPGGQARPVRRPRRHLPPGCGAGHDHVLAPGGGVRGGHLPPGRRGRAALLQPRAR